MGFPVALSGRLSHLVGASSSDNMCLGNSVSQETTASLEVSGRDCCSSTSLPNSSMPESCVHECSSGKSVQNVCAGATAIGFDDASCGASCVRLSSFGGSTSSKKKSSSALRCTAIPIGQVFNGDGSLVLGSVGIQQQDKLVPPGPSGKKEPVDDDTMSALTDSIVGALHPVNRKDVVGLLLKDRKGMEGKYCGATCWSVCWFGFRRVPHGRGVMEYASGMSYHGDWSRGIWHGHGKLLAGLGSYEGGFRHGRFWGLGHQRWPDRSEYEGRWEAGKRSGRGTFRSQEGSGYQGMWVNDKMEGYGRRTFVDGSQCEGLFAGGCPKGVCKYIDSNGTEFEKTWVVQELQDGSRYEGLWTKGKPSGFGTRRYPNGDTYEGTLCFNKSIVSEVAVQLFCLATKDVSLTARERGMGSSFGARGGRMKGRGKTTSAMAMGNCFIEMVGGTRGSFATTFDTVKAVALGLMGLSHTTGIGLMDCLHTCAAVRVRASDESLTFFCMI